VRTTPGLTGKSAFFVSARSYRFLSRNSRSFDDRDGPDVLFAGGGSDWLPRESNGNVSQIKKWQDRGYNFVHSNTTLNEIGNDERALGLFSTSTMPTWLDRHVFQDNLQKPSFAAYNTENQTFTAPNTDSPGLKEMAIKAIDILHKRSQDKDVPFMTMIEAASIDKAMHAADMERAMGELLEFDNTIKTVLAHLKKVSSPLFLSASLTLTDNPRVRV